MRTSIRTFVGAALALLALSGCKKDFLDQDPTQLFTADQLKKASQWNESINEGYINGVLNTFFKDGQATPSRHDDFSQKAFDISSDLMSGDMELQGGARIWVVHRSRSTPLVPARCCHQLSRLAHQLPYDLYGE